MGNNFETLTLFKLTSHRIFHCTGCICLIMDRTATDQFQRTLPIVTYVQLDNIPALAAVDNVVMLSFTAQLHNVQMMIIEGI